MKISFARCVLASAGLTLAVASVARAQEAASAPAPAASAVAPITMLRLKDGSIQWGTIQSHSPDGLVFQRMDTNGIIRLGWSLLDPEEEDQLRTKYGYVDLTSNEVLVSADKIVTVKGVELIGIIVDRTPDAILLKTATTTIPIPKDQIAQAGEVVQVPARDIFTPEELYARGAATVDLGKAEGNFKLAEYCESVFDFAHAIEHYKKAAEIDPAYRKEEIAIALSRAAEKAKAAAQLEYLSDVDQLQKRNKFDEALARADAFKEKFPNSALIPDAKKKHDRIIKARAEYLSTEVVRAWAFYAGRIARDMAGKTLEETMAYLDEKMKTDIVASVTKEMQKISKDATEDVVRQLWKNRKKVRYQTASYGLGTWLIGKDAALKGYDKDGDAKDKKPETEIDKQRADLDLKIKKFLQAQDVARKAQSANDKKEDREAFWKEFPIGARASWILAYYVENSGDYEINPKPLIAACKECGGRGIVEYAMAGANVSRSAIGKDTTALKRECESCHGIGAVRRILYR